ncbi:OmpA Outer membrane protein and related peptidoglycan-associated (lipo)proteins [Burkholderiaceae bacterium]
MKKFLLLLSLIAVLSGCASGVKLDEVPVDERSGSPANLPGSAAAGSTLDARGLNGLNANGMRPGPAGVDNVILFDYDSFTVRADYQATLAAHARYLRGDSTLRANIEGHTDDRGGREYNLGLGQKRSEAVRRALSVLGVPDNQMEAVSYGKEKPAAQGGDEAAFAKNRRAEITYR